MRTGLSRIRAKSAGLLCGLGALAAVGGCDIGNITTSTTLDGRDAIIQIVRGAILPPIDAYITTGITQLLGADD